MNTVVVTSNDGETTVEVSFDELVELLGEKYILGDEEGSEFAYLAALALDTYEDDRYNIEDTIAEFIGNTDALDQVTVQDTEEIKILLQ